MEEGRFFMKAVKVEVSKPEFKVWCESCCLRIAPLEERKVVRDKAYHSNCYTKLPAKA
jgi:hypothetical protein